VRHARGWLVPGIALAACLGAPVSGRAQQPKFSTDVNVVNILANVFDLRGSLVQYLSRNDFLVEEDGHPETIRYFSKQTDLPLTLGLLVDTSGSMSHMFDEERSASAVFLQEVIRPKHDRVFVMNFDEQVRILQTLTSSRKQLDASLRRLEPDEFRVPVRTSGEAFSPDGRSTALFDAIYVASEAMMKNQKGRKALIVISDGMDVNSERSLADAIAAAQKADTLVYTIHIFDSALPTLLNSLQAASLPGDPQSNAVSATSTRTSQKLLNEGKESLQRLSFETGGASFEVSETTPFSAIYEQIQSQLRSQYNLGYSPDSANLEQGFHKIQVSTTKSGFKVQARNGYYAEKR
jgi:VWFA-related protein